jgi:flagellar hook-basal body complex protein FliE
MALDRIDGLGAPKVPGADGAAGGPGSAGKVSGVESGPSFGDILLDSIREADRLQDSADQAIQGLAAGKRDDVAGVMTAVEKADLAFRTLMQVRNKLVDAYEELMRLRI